MKIQDVMTRRVCTVSGRATLADAARLMWENNCGVIPVVDDAEAIFGVITDRDVCMGALTQARPIHEIPVTMSMSKNVATCRDTDDLETVEAIMAERRIRRVPVVDGARRAVGAEAALKRADRPGDAGTGDVRALARELVAGLAGEAHRERGQLGGAALEAAGAEVAGVGAKRVRRQHLGAGREVVAVDGADLRGVVEQRVRGPQRRGHAGAAALELRAGRAVEDDAGWLIGHVPGDRHRGRSGHVLRDR